MIGPDSNDNITIVRLGGHLEKGETIENCLKREVYEEAMVKINILPVDQTYRFESWKNRYYEVVNYQCPLKPILVKDNHVDRKSLIFFASTDEKVTPSKEAFGLIKLSMNEIHKIINNRVTIREFTEMGGEIILQQQIDENLRIHPGVILGTIVELDNLDNNIFKQGDA